MLLLKTRSLLTKEISYEECLQIASPNKKKSLIGSEILKHGKVFYRTGFFSSKSVKEMQNLFRSRLESRVYENLWCFSRFSKQACGHVYTPKI